MGTDLLKFAATPEHGDVSAMLMLPPDATHLLVLGHGASSDMRAPMLQSIAEALAVEKIGTLRYNFPYSEHKRGRNPPAVCTATVRSAGAAARNAAPGIPILAGGHSFSGRMTTTAASEQPIEGVSGIVLFGFPLHLAGKPDTKRAAHLSRVTVPMLFLSGTRDDLAQLDLLETVCANLTLATLHKVDTADHGFRVLKRSRTAGEDVFAELARVTREWAARLSGRPPNASSVQ